MNFEKGHNMDVFEAIKTRRSIRKYKSGLIPDEELKMIFEAARWAPSAGNRQPWCFVVVRDAEKRKALAKAANNQKFLENATVIITALGDTKISKRWYDKDPMIAVEHMVLAATALGYGTCWIGAFNEDEVKRLLKIPKEMSVIALLPIGVSNETLNPRPRKEISEIFFEEEYSKPIGIW
ncbi:MAG: nitroreductase family protein [Candidatus Bathyarchaeia archaeon]